MPPAILRKVSLLCLGHVDAKRGRPLRVERYGDRRHRFSPSAAIGRQNGLAGTANHPRWPLGVELQIITVGSKASCMLNWRAAHEFGLCQLISGAPARCGAGLGNPGQAALQAHDVALLDAKKGLRMFEKVGVPNLGIVKNMTVHVCSNCGHVEPIFGADGGKKMAAEYEVDYLGALPLAMQIRVQADSGKPTVVSDPDGEVVGLYKAVAGKIAQAVAAKNKDYSSKFPSIKISKET